jgi:TrmH family RNA methyltransferase
MQKMTALNVVLVRAENPINIGQTARAMKNFGARNLSLVNCVPHQVNEAYTPGWKAKEIIDGAKVCTTVSEAVEKAVLTVGFTARIREERGGPVLLSEMVPKILEAMEQGPVCFLFGNEKNGLSKEELDLCNVAVRIPTDGEYESLNLAHAAAVSLYAVYSQIPDSQNVFGWRERYFATEKEFLTLMEHFREVMNLLGYQDIKSEDISGKVHKQIANFFRKGRLEKRELNLFEAFLSKVNERLRSK